MAISLHSSKAVDKKEILHTVSNTDIYCSSNKVGTAKDKVAPVLNESSTTSLRLMGEWIYRSTFS
jgi:hypothetical protein